MTEQQKTISRPQRGPRRRIRREAPEFDHRVVDVRRVTRVMAGGRRFSFSVVVIAGDKNGRVGVGIGKASDTSLAIEKALNDAKKKMITVKRTDDKSIAHEVECKLESAHVIIKPARGKGLVAGSSPRVVLELGGVTNVSVKILSRSKNKLNNARAIIKALKEISAQK